MYKDDPYTDEDPRDPRQPPAGTIAPAPPPQPVDAPVPPPAPPPTAPAPPPPAPPPGGGGGTPPPATYSYDEALQWARGQGLQDSQLGQIKNDLGFTEGARIDASAQGPIKAWIDAHRPSGGSAPPPTVQSGVPAPPTVASSSNPQNQGQADDLFNFLMGRAKQSQQIDPNDPMIRTQADNYAANLTRQGRRYMSELAERKGPGGNIGAESRMMAEKNAQASAGHEGELLQHESDQRRQEIEHALTTGAQFLTSQQQMALQRELATIDNNMKMYQTQMQESQFGRSLGQNESQFGRTQAQQGSQFGQNLDLQNRTLTQQGDLARAGMAQSAGQFGQTMSAREAEFAKNLSQRAYEYDTDDEFRRSPYATK